MNIVDLVGYAVGLRDDRLLHARPAPAAALRHNLEARGVAYGSPPASAGGGAARDRPAAEPRAALGR